MLHVAPCERAAKPRCLVFYVRVRVCVCVCVREGEAEGEREGTPTHPHPPTHRERECARKLRVRRPQASAYANTLSGKAWRYTVHTLCLRGFATPHNQSPVQNKARGDERFGGGRIECVAVIVGSRGADAFSNVQPVRTQQLLQIHFITARPVHFQGKQRLDPLCAQRQTHAFAARHVRARGLE